MMLVIGIAAAVAQLSFHFINDRLTKFRYHINGKLTELFLNTTKYDMLFIGSSKTHADINPRIIDSICGLSSYNAGIDGISLFEYQMVLEGYLVNHPPPRFLVLSFDLHSFNGVKKFFDYVQYLPYISNKVIDTTLANNGHPTLPGKLLPFLKLTDYLEEDKTVTVLKSFLGQNDIPKGDFQYKGYLSNSDIVLKSAFFPVEPQHITEKGLFFLQSIIETCKKNKIGLILLYLPEYQSRIVQLTPNADNILATISRIAHENNIPYIRHDSLPLCADAIYFRNTGHLNKAGAKEYSSVLANQLKQLINN